MRISGTMAAVMMTSLMALPATLLAQDARDDSVLTRQRPEYDPLGIRAGSFLLFPQVRLYTAYDDNIFAVESNEDDDIVLGVQPSVTARSQWSRHALNVTVDADTAFFVDENDSNYQDFGLATDGRIDVVGESAIRYRAFIRQEHEDRDSPDEAGADDVTDLIDGGFAINYRHVINRLFIQPGVSVRRRDFDDVDNINNDDRDIWKYAPSLRVGYAVSPGVAVFVDGEFNQVIYDETPNDVGVDRDSEGFAVTLGTEFDLTGKLVGELQAGYQVQEYDDGDLDDFSGLRAGGQVTYNATPLTALILSLEGGLEETTVTLGGEQASANRQAIAGLELVHELRRNIILRAQGTYIRDDFEGIDRTDDRFELGAGIGYALNRNLSLDLNYEFSTRDSDAVGADFDRNIVTVGLTARL